MRIHNHNLAGALDHGGVSGHQPDRTASVNDDGLPRLYARQFGGVPASGKNIRQHDVVVFFFLRIVGELEAVEVGVGNTQVFSLSSAVRPHACETVSRAGRSRIGGKTRPSQTRLTILAEADRKSTRLNSSHANISYAVF